MKLVDSEVLFVSQVFFHFKNSTTQHHWDYDESLNNLLKKCESYLVSKEETNPGVLASSPCAWHQESEEQPDDEKLEEPQEEIKLRSFLNLGSLKVSYDGSKRKMVFEEGISSKMLDLNFDDGDEILCDITEIERTETALTVNCAEGWVDFDVQKFPKDWTTLLSLRTLYKVTV
jgi:hypothetical protein